MKRPEQYRLTLRRLKRLVDQAKALTKDKTERYKFINSIL